MEIKVKKLVEEAVVPKFNYDTDAGADLTATSTEYEPDSRIITYKIGLAFEIPKGYFMQIYPRSSVAKYDLELVNSVGIIDADYRGEVMFKFRCTNPNRTSGKYYEVGDRIGQAIIRKCVPTEYVEVTELAESDRGIGGFGSTGV